MPDPGSETPMRPISSEGGEELFHASLEAYQRRLGEDTDDAYKQFGMTLYHSLPVDQRTRLAEEYGLNPDNVTTHYNLGVLAASQENWPEAIAEFKKAVEMDGDLKPARFNLALATEKSGDAKGARRLFEELAGSLEGDAEWADDLKAVRAHLAGEATAE